MFGVYNHAPARTVNVNKQASMALFLDVTGGSFSDRKGSIG